MASHAMTCASQGVLMLKQKGPKPEILRRISQLKNQALQLKHWEGVRDLDFYTACATEDEKLFHHLFFGTPLSA